MECLTKHKIKIISESKSRQLKPDYYLVLPWHFKKKFNKKKISEKKVLNLYFTPKLKFVSAKSLLIFD